MQSSLQAKLRTSIQRRISSTTKIEAKKIEDLCANNQVHDSRNSIDKYIYIYKTNLKASKTFTFNRNVAHTCPVDAHKYTLPGIDKQCNTRNFNCLVGVAKVHQA